MSYLTILCSCENLKTWVKSTKYSRFYGYCGMQNKTTYTINFKNVTTKNNISSLHALVTVLFDLSFQPICSCSDAGPIIGG